MRWRSPTLEMGCDDDDVLNPEISAGLRGFLPGHFPLLHGIEIEYEWSGLMAFTPDHNPLVGPLPGRPGEYIAAGYSGHGMPLAFNAGRDVAALAAGREPNRWVEAFLPERFAREPGQKNSR
jgi:glycine/D-amino acid oxidase-like deaminating enzyme